MKKLISLIKASMTESMNLFRIRNKNQSNASKRILPIVLFCFIFLMMWVYANGIMEKLDALNAEYVGLSIFIILTTILTIVEGVYKTSSLLFNCKDDNLMFTLPIKRGTVLFIRMFKFYVFELLYNSMFLLPAMVAYIRWADNISWTYYLVSIIGLLLFPIIPIAISCIFGMIISFISTKFKRKNVVQIIVTTVFLVGVFALSFNSNGLLNKIVENATSINEMISKIYYPAGLYIDLITNFNIQSLLIFIGIHIGVAALTIFVLSKIYFKINSNTKKVSAKKTNNSSYKIKTSNQTVSLIKKELKKFISSPVFVTNAGFGLVLFLLGVIIAVIKCDGFASSIADATQMDIGVIQSYIPLALLAFIIAASLMTSITSSMISLEGKSINLLKSLPIKPYTIIQSKVLTAVLIMIPVFLVGDIIVIARFGCSIPQAIMILVGTIVLPFVSETIGIIMNLKYPKMDATSDTEVVKQSFSSTISVFIGMGLIGVTAFGIYSLFSRSVHSDIIMAVVLGIYILIYLGLWIYLKKTSEKRFNELKT